ncbi:MAG: hypothetical protein NZT61_07830, partial [Deltaproteobacteria bacterium]|nr:hypothetical protein [Deltaproteobacteria bacterium]
MIRYDLSFRRVFSVPDRGFVHSHRRDQALQSPDIQKRAGDFLSSEGTVNKASGIAPKSIDDTEFLRWLAKVADSKLHGKGISKEELQQYL